jgi:hypothetical protein
MGAEGADMSTSSPATRLFFGENRGDPIKFATRSSTRAPTWSIGHGPHVLRGMEFYQGKLIAYSLGNFAGGGKTLSSQRRAQVRRHPARLAHQDGSWAGGGSCRRT